MPVTPLIRNVYFAQQIFSFAWLHFYISLRVFSRKKKSWMVAELIQNSIKVNISLYVCIYIFNMYDVLSRLPVQFSLPEQLPQAVSLDFHYSSS